MEASSNDLMSKLQNHGVNVKQFIKKRQKDQFEE